MSTQNLAYYLALPYAVEVLPISAGEGGGYAACIPCLGRYSAVGDGETPKAAYADLRAALPSLLTGWLAQGIAIPEPGKQKARSPSGY